MDSNEILKLRLKLEQTQKEFAGTIGVTEQTIRNWECGRTVPTGLNTYRLYKLGGK